MPARIPGPLGVSATSGLITTPSILPQSAEGRSQADFKHAVLQGQISRKQRQGKTYFDAIPQSQLADLELKLGAQPRMLRMRKEAARSCLALLKAARKDLDDARKAEDPVALRTTAIGLCSAYRDYSEDTTAWSNTFDKHYDKPDVRARLREAPGGLYGDAAVRLFVELMSPIKAPPGFSNHSNGKAVDFATTESGRTYGADTSRHAEWRRTWLHPWLVANAGRFNFKALPSEEWHWDWGA